MSVRGHDDSISVVGNETGLVDVSTCTDANEYSESFRHQYTQVEIFELEMHVCTQLRMYMQTLTRMQQSNYSYRPH